MHYHAIAQRIQKTKLLKLLNGFHLAAAQGRSAQDQDDAMGRRTEECTISSLRSYTDDEVQTLNGSACNFIQ